MRLILGGMALVLLAPLTACGGEDGPPNGESASPSADCRLLNAEERAKVAGVKTDLERPVGMKTAGQQCRWIAAKGRAIIETTTAESPEWASKVPTVMDQIEKSGTLSDNDAREFAEARKLLKEPGGLNPDQACDLFTLMAEIGGAPEGSDTMVNYLRLGADRMAVTAQTCRDGRFTSVVLSKPEIPESAAVEDAMLDTVAKAHTRAVGADAD